MNFSVPDTTPFYKKLAYVLFCIIALGYLAILAKELLSPLLFSFLFSVVLLPIARFLEQKWRFPRGIAALVSLLTLIGSVGLLLYFLGSQVGKLSRDWPMFEQQLNLSIDHLQDWLTKKYHIDAKSQLTYFNDAKTKILASGTLIVGTTFLSVSSLMLFLIFTLIDTFFLLVYRQLILTFLISVCRKENSGIVHAIVQQTQYIIRKYIVGLLLQMGIVSAVVCAAFFFLGLRYALLLGLLTGLLNVIPYIGIFTALVLCLTITFGTAASGTTLLLVAGVVIVVHLIDSNVLLPVVVGSKVKINALITVLGVIVGEMLWGIPGMFLSIPVIAVMKIIFDRVESLQPWGILLGEESKENGKKRITL